MVRGPTMRGQSFHTVSYKSVESAMHVSSTIDSRRAWPPEDVSFCEVADVRFWDKTSLIPSLLRLPRKFFRLLSITKIMRIRVQVKTTVNAINSVWFNL